jgi:hypothetical protein
MTNSNFVLHWLSSLFLLFTLIERKIRMPQIQGVTGEAVVNLLQTRDNAEDGVSSAFPGDKQNRDKIAEFISR